MATETQRRKTIERTLSGYPFPNFSALEIIGHPDYDNVYSYALNFANYTYDHADLRKFTEQYIAEQQLSYDLRKVPDWAFYLVGIQAWLSVKGASLPQEQLKRINRDIKTLETKYNIEEEKPTDFRAVRTSNLIAELEGLLDDVYLGKTLTQPLEIIRNAGIVSLNEVREWFATQLEEITNPENAEYFGNTKKLAIVLKIILSDLEKADDLKPERKTRVVKPRAINPSKAVKNLKHLKEDKETGLKSINAENIIGSEILWTFNVKTRKLGRYIAKDGSKLMVKGSTVQNYDESLSTMKIVRKPKDVLPKVMTAGKVDQRKILEGINAVEQKLNGRINKETILMRVF